MERNAHAALDEKRENAEPRHVLWKPWALDLADDVLALVEIAKAARALMEDVDEIMDEDLRLDALKQKIGAAFLGYGGAWNHEDEFRAALARLDSGVDACPACGNNELCSVCLGEDSLLRPEGDRG
jgi:hypothetical protein